MPRTGTVEKNNLENFVLSLWGRDFTAKQIREAIQVERGVDVSEGSIYKFMERARAGKVPQAQKLLKGRYGDADYRKEIERLFNENVEMKDLILERSQNAEQDADFIKLAREFSNLAKKLLDGAKLLGSMDGRVRGTPAVASSQEASLTGEDLLRAWDESQAKSGDD